MKNNNRICKKIPRHFSSRHKKKTMSVNFHETSNTEKNDHDHSFDQIHKACTVYFPRDMIFFCTNFQFPKFLKELNPFSANCRGNSNPSKYRSIYS